MREVAELSKSAIFGGGDYNDRADSTEENSAGKTPKKNIPELYQKTEYLKLGSKCLGMVWLW
jgi:hypothetical protein